MFLKFDKVLAVVNAQFHRAKYSGSWVIVLTEKTIWGDAENNTVVATANSNNAIH